MSVNGVNLSTAALLSQAYRSTAQTTAGTSQDSGSKSLNITDVLTLSPEGRKALDFPWLFGTKPVRPTTLVLTRAYASSQLDIFNEKFQALMRDNGIDTSEPITLGIEQGTGRVIVTSDHPDAEKIESLLAADPKLPNMYVGITKALEIVKHSDEYAKHTEAYGQGLEAAGAQYAYLFGGQFNATWDTSVTFSGDDYEVVYSRLSESESEPG